MRTTFDTAAGDQTDELILSNAGFYNLASVKLSSVGPAFTWTLYFAAAALASPLDIVVVDSGDVPVTVVAPHGGVQVVGVSLDCLQFIVPVGTNGQPFGLRMSTTGKVGVARVRLVWSSTAPFQGDTL